METLQSTLLSAVCVSKAPVLRQYVFKYLGKGTPVSGPFAKIIVQTRARIMEEVLHENMVVLRPPKVTPPKVNDHNAQSRVVHALQQAVQREQARQQRQLLAQQQEMLWRDHAQRQQVLDKLVRELWQENQDELQLRLVDKQPLVRWATVQVIAQRRLPLAVDLIDLLTDPSVEVREAARQALVRLSRGCDFGPTPQATVSQRHQATAAWQRWLSLQDAPRSSPGDGTKLAITQNVFASMILR